MSIVRIIVLLVALSVLAYAGYRLYLIMNDYRLANEAYSSVRDKYTTPASVSPDASAAPEAETPDLLPKYEDAAVPVTLNWEDLKKENPDIIGWLYVDAEPSISYPICWAKGDDDFYLHRSYTKEYLYAGSIFLEGLNNPDFSDPLSIIYGHNMKDGSMFGKLKNFFDQAKVDANQYFWILTPEADYRYRIISVMHTDPTSPVYQLFSESGGEFLEYEKQMQAASEVKNDAAVYEDDKCVLLSTCVSDHVHRTVVLGRCVSTTQPVKTTDDPVVSTGEDKTVIVSDTVDEDTGFDIGDWADNLFGLEGIG